MRFALTLAIALFTTLLTACGADAPSEADAKERTVARIAKNYTAVRNMWGQVLSPLETEVRTIALTGKKDSREPTVYTYSYVAELAFNKDVYVNNVDLTPRACENAQFRKSCIFVKKGETLRLTGNLQYGKYDSAWQFDRFRG